MKILMSLVLPLYVHTTVSQTKKGKAILNLNNYRNWHHTKSNNAKKAVKKLLHNKLKKINLGKGPFRLQYTYYHGNRRRIDLSNPCAIIDKFVCDALTELKCWPDDNTDYVQEVEFIWGGIDPNKKGYCELLIYEI